MEGDDKIDGRAVVAEVIEQVVKIKEIQNSKEERQTKLTSMRCFPEVENMIGNGEPVKDIVYFIQVEKEEYTDVKPETLAGTLYAYISKQKSKFFDDRSPTKHVSLIRSLGERVDPLDALNMLFAIQVDRLMIDHGTEKKIGKLINSNNSVVKVIKEIAEAIKKVENDSVKYKIHSSNPKTPSQTLDQVERMRKIYEAKFGSQAAIWAIDPVKRRMLINAMDRVRKGNAVPLRDALEKVGQQIEEQKPKDQ